MLIVNITLDSDLDNFVKIILEEKNKKGSNGMEPNLLTPSCNNFSKAKYLNVSIEMIHSYAGMAEWLTQLVNTKCPSGSVGSIPTSSVTENS